MRGSSVCGQPVLYVPVSLCSRFAYIYQVQTVKIFKREQPRCSAGRSRRRWLNFVNRSLTWSSYCSQVWRPNPAQDMFHQARRFAPLICYLVTGTAVTTVSQIISNKVIERKSAASVPFCTSRRPFFFVHHRHSDLCAIAALHQRLCSGLSMCKVPQHSCSQPCRLCT